MPRGAQDSLPAYSPLSAFGDPLQAGAWLAIQELSTDPAVCLTHDAFRSVTQLIRQMPPCHFYGQPNATILSVILPKSAGHWRKAFHIARSGWASDLWVEHKRQGTPDCMQKAWTMPKGPTLKEDGCLCQLVVIIHDMFQEHLVFTTSIWLLNDPEVFSRTWQQNAVRFATVVHHCWDLRQSIQPAQIFIIARHYQLRI